MAEPVRDGKEAPALVIGIGNSLRGDDGVGGWLAQQLRGWRRADLEATAVVQLTPEWAPRLAAAERVLFIDACFADPSPGGAAADGVPPSPRLLPLEPGGPGSMGASRLSHHTTPEALLTLAEHLYGRRPPAWCLLIPAHDDRLGEVLSPATAAQLEPARAALSRWLDGDA